MSGERGFTLIEVLVALAIMALAFAALLRASALAAENSDALRERMLAGWLAENRMAWLQVQRTLPTPGESAGEISLGVRQWRWRQQVSPTEDARLVRVEIHIMTPEPSGYRLAELSGLLTAGTAP